MTTAQMVNDEQAGARLARAIAKQGEDVRKFRGNPWAALLVVSLGFFMTLLDLTIVNIAIPDMISRLHASLDDVLWVINAYTLVLAVLLITAGRLGDLLGQRLMFVTGVVIFTAASAACGLAPGPSWLIAFRVGQGLGVVVIALAILLIPEVTERRKHRIDIAGVLLASSAMLAICYGLVEGQRYNWGTITSFVTVPLVIGAGAVLLAVFLLAQAARQDREPLVPFVLFRNRNFSLMNWVMCTVATGMMGIFLPLTIYLQSVLGFSALKAGLALAPAPVIAMFVAPMAGRLSDRIGGKFILITGLTAFGTGMGWIALIATTSSAWYDLLAPLIVAGFGMGCTFPPMTTVAVRDVQPQLAGAASGMLNTTRQAGAVIGTAAVGALLQNRLFSSLTAQARTRAAGLPPAVRDKLVTGIQQAAKTGTGAGSGQGGGFRPPAGTPPTLAHQIEQVAHAVFTHGFVDAMRPTMIMPIAVLGVGMLSCLAVKSATRPIESSEPEVTKDPTRA